MREIKFRAWDKSDKKMIHDIYPATNGDVAGEYNGRFCLRLPSERVIIEQFTGVKDIYEGDIIEHGNFYWAEGSSGDYFGTEPQNSWHVVEAYPERIKSIVCFEKGCFILKSVVKNKKGESYISRTLISLLNDKWDIVDQLHEMHPDESEMNIEEHGTIESQKEYLSKLEVIGNIHEIK